MSLVPGAIERILWIVIILLVSGLLAGSWLNRRHSKAIGEWLQTGIKWLGGQTTWKWIRSMSSGAQVTIEGATKPFLRLEISYFLLTREFAPLLAVELLRGKRDLLAIRADLREMPGHEVEIVPARGKLQRALDSASSARPITWQDGPAGFSIGSRDDGAQAAINRLKPFVERYGPSIQRLSLRRRQPHVVLFVHLNGLKGNSSEELLRALRKALSD